MKASKEDKKLVVILLTKDLRLGQGDAVLVLLLHLLDGKHVAREKDVLKRIVALGLELLPASREKNRGESDLKSLICRHLLAIIEDGNFSEITEPVLPDNLKPLG